MRERDLVMSGGVLQAVIIVKVLRLSDLALKCSNVEQHTAPFVDTGHLSCESVCLMGRQ